MPERSVALWNTMIDVLVRSGEFDMALGLFREMQGSFEADAYALQSVVYACAGLTSLSLGLWVHAYVLRFCDTKSGNDLLLKNSLVEMYCKCGMLNLAKQVFRGMIKRDVNSWNSMILGLAMHEEHNYNKLALKYFDEVMIDEGLIPNSIRFVGILSACNHGCMVELGREYFDKMVRVYSILNPQLEHYECMVDLLARAGLIDEALDLVSNMPMKPDVVIWRTLLDSCCKKNVSLELSRGVADKILELDEMDSNGVYVLLSRVYASANRWNEVGLVRKLMTDKGVRKEPGCSSIEINMSFLRGILHTPKQRRYTKF